MGSGELSVTVSHRTPGSEPCMFKACSASRGNRFTVRMPPSQGVARQINTVNSYISGAYIVLDFAIVYNPR